MHVGTSLGTRRRFLGPSSPRHARGLVRDPFEQLAGLDAECDAEPVERVSGEAAERDVRIGETVRRGDG